MDRCISSSFLLGLHPSMLQRGREEKIIVAHVLLDSSSIGKKAIIEHYL